jgi:membrane protein
MSISRILANAASAFRHQGCISLAASLAFYSFLSLFPMVFLLLYFVSFVVSQDVIGYQFLLIFLKGFLPSVGTNSMRCDGSFFSCSCGSAHWSFTNWTTR